MVKEEQNIKSNRVLYADVLRAAAILAVVLLHITGPLLTKFNSINRSWWWCGNLIDSAVRWSIPVFIMLSGMFLLDPNKSEKNFFKRRFRKVAIPLVVWYFLYRLLLPNIRKYLQGEPPIINFAIFKQFFTGQNAGPLWFLYVLIGLYLITPVLRVYISKAQKKDLHYFLGLWFFSAIILGFLRKTFDFNLGVDLSYLYGYIGLFVLGYYLKITDMSKYKQKIYLFGLLGLIVTIVGTFLLTIKNGSFVSCLYDYLAINVISMAIAVFVYMKSLNWSKILGSNSKRFSIILKISKNSLGIYVIHSLILSSIRLSNINIFFIHPLLGIAVTFTLVTLASLLLSCIMQKIPVLRMIVP